MTGSVIRAEASSSAPRERLWSLASDVERWPERLPTIDSVRRLGDGAGGGGQVGVGSRFEVRQPGLPKAIWEVTNWQPGRTFTWVSTAPGVRSTAVHTVYDETPGGESAGSRLELELAWSGPLSPVVRLLIGAKSQQMVTTEAETFARLAADPAQ